MSERQLRVCDVCNQADDHPRHVQRSEDERRVLTRHMDCCAAAGCDICAATEVEYGQRRGQELIDHLDQVRNG